MRRQLTCSSLSTAFPFPQEDYPVYVMPGEDVREKIDAYNGDDMQEVIEVYSMKLDIEQQLDEHRAFHIE